MGAVNTVSGSDFLLCLCEETVYLTVCTTDDLLHT